MKIPKIIHQLWSDVYKPLPDQYKELGKTWKRDYPSWKYEFWDNNRMMSFIKKHYPEYWKIYNQYPYNIQRWDVIRYLILDKIGGMYVDFDYESIEPMDKLIEEKTCCFALEPESMYIGPWIDAPFMFNNALMMSTPNHPFLKQIIKNVFSEKILQHEQNPKHLCVLNTTGPWMLVNLYNELEEEEKRNIYLIPAQYVTPFDFYQAYKFRKGEVSDELENCLEDAYAVHYYFSEWRNISS